MHAYKIIALLDAEQGAIARIAAGGTLDQALELILQAMAEQADDGMLPCILLLDQRDQFSAVVAPDLPADYSASLLAAEVDPHSGPFGGAAFSGAPVFCSDIGQDQRWSRGRTDALLHGLRACWAAPVFGARGRILGVLGMFFNSAKHPTQVETELLNVCARGCAHAIERYQCEKTIVDGEQHIRHAFELNAQVLWTAHADGQLDYVARRWHDWTGNAGLGASWREALHPDDQAASSEAWRQAIASNTPYDVEHRVRMQDGSYRWMRSRASCRLDEHGKCLKWYGSTEDIHQHSEARSALLKSEAEFRSLAEAMPNQCWIARADGALCWFNQRVYEYTDIAPGQLDGAAWGAALHPDDLGAVLDAWARSIGSGLPYEAEFRVRRGSDGSYRWFLSRAIPVCGEDGVVQRWVGTNTDVQEQKNVFEKLAYLNSSLEIEVANRTADRDRMWRLSTDIMLVVDFSGLILALNPAWSAILGRSGDAALGTDILGLVHPDERLASLRELERLARGVTTMHFENRIEHQDGSYRWISWTAVPDQELVHAIGRDVTDEKEARLALARSEQALLQAQKMESIGKLTGGVAHDFNNVLQIISGNLQLLQLQVIGNDAAHKRLASAGAAVARGARLSSQLLAFARRQPLNPVVIDVEQFLAGMDELLRRAVGETIMIRISACAGLWHTLVDPNQLENVLLNIVINARDAMQGSGSLGIALDNAVLDDSHAEVAPGDYVVIAVSDSGHGMPKNILEQIFEPFFTTKKEGEGTGLGLSMAYCFVKQSHGHIDVASEVGQGSTFRLYLPRSLEAQTDLPAAPSGPVVGGKETILVVEDDMEVQNTVVDLLRGLGYTVLKASDGRGALAVIDSGVPIDLLFSDVVMPGELRGTELAHRARLVLPGLQVLFTSGYTQDAIVHGGRLDAGVELLSKPYRREDLAHKVRQVLAKS